MDCIEAIWSIDSDINPYSYEQPHAVIEGTVYCSQSFRDQDRHLLTAFDESGNVKWEVDLGPGAPRVAHVGESGATYIVVANRTILIDRNGIIAEWSVTGIGIQSVYGSLDGVVFAFCAAKGSVLNSDSVITRFSAWAFRSGPPVYHEAL